MDNFRQFLYNKCLSFSVRIVRVSQYLQKEKQLYVISNQICRSGTSIGANLAEAQYGSSRKDFLAKCYISLRESFETCYWLDVLFQADLISERQYSSLYEDCTELKKLFISITNKTKNNLKEEKADSEHRVHDINGMQETPNS